MACQHHCFSTSFPGPSRGREHGVSLSRLSLLRLEAGRLASKGRPYRSVTVDGWQILVGRGAADNDALTFRIANPRDTWLHVAGGTPGSHVVIQNPELRPIPREVIEAAAELAAWHSKARAASRVEVHVCRVADVSKPRGAPAGLVQIRHFKKLRVIPTDRCASNPER